MITARFFFPDLVPVSVNSGYFRNRSLNYQARKVRAQILLALQSPENQEQISLLQRNFSPKKNSLAVVYRFEMPTLFTKEGNISNKSKDLDNVIKIIQDSIFNPRYDSSWLSLRKSQERNLYRGYSSLVNVGIDDRFIIDLAAQKRFSERFSLSVIIHIQSKDLD